VYDSQAYVPTCFLCGRQAPCWSTDLPLHCTAPGGPSGPSQHASEADTQVTGCSGAHILLRLKPSGKGDSPLRHAKFSFVTEHGQVEGCIAASCGENVVFWNFRR
jgi:hypothetical protein